MTDSNTYPVSGNVEWRTEQAFVDVLKYDDTIAAIFGSPSAVNIRRAKDTSKGERSLPALAVECLVEQTIARTNEYHGRVQIIAATQADNDGDGQKVQALAGAVRDCLHKDSTSSYTGHFTGDCEGFLEALNKTQRDIVFHQVHEMDTDNDDEGRTRRLIINVDVWMYPGKVS
jgi:hypothetical protein